MLLQADILPQKLSRRWEIFISAARSGVACTSTGTFSVDRRNRIHNPPLFAEIGQCNNDTINLVAMLAEEIAAQARFRRGFDRAELGFLRSQRDGADARPPPALSASLPGPSFAR